MTRLMILLGTVALCLTAPAWAAEPIPVFREAAALRVEMTFPTLVVEKELPGAFAYLEGAAKTGFAVVLSPRGHSKRDLCPSFPPVRLRFDAAKFPGTVFAGARDDDFKLATQCRAPAAEYYTENVRLEHALYRLLGLSGLTSYRTRLLEAEYRDPAGRLLTAGPGFLLEPTKDAVARLGLRPDSPAGGDRAEVEVRLAHLFVRNVDYSVANAQNVKPVMNAQDAVVAYLPYDFDMSEMTVGNDYFKNAQVDWPRYDRDTLEELTRSYGRAVVAPLLAGVLDKEPAIRAEIERSLVSDASKAKLRARYALFFAAARAFAFVPPDGALRQLETLGSRR